MFEDLSGVDLSTTDGATTFLELGFDSLFLTQVTQALQEKFGVKITFRQLLNDVSEPGCTDRVCREQASARCVCRSRQDRGAAGTARPAAVAVAAAPPLRTADIDPADAGMGDGVRNRSIERLMREQLQAMNQLFAKQLEALQGAGPGQPPRRRALRLLRRRRSVRVEPSTGGRRLSADVARASRPATRPSRSGRTSRRKPACRRS